MIDLEIMQDASEVIHYDFPEISYAVQERLLSNYTDMRALCHWHDDIELIYIFDGTMYYDVNGKKYRLQTGDTLFVNTKQLHYGYSDNHQECAFLCVLLHPELLRVNNDLYRRYVYPVLQYAANAILFSAKDSCAAVFTQLFHDVLACHRAEQRCQEFQLLGCFYTLWSLIYRECDMQERIISAKEDPDLQSQRQMVSFIYQHYQEHISLEEIAAAGMVSRSKCCRIFQKYLSQSPVSFLNEYRMEVSCSLLSSTSYSITRIATSCGFNHLSYYSRMFLQRYGCTPNAFRKSHQRTKK